MTIVAQAYDYVIGADTHAQTHTVCITASGTGEVLGTRTFPTTSAGLNRCCGWITRTTEGRVLAAVEGTRSYGASGSGARCRWRRDCRGKATTEEVSQRAREV